MTNLDAIARDPGEFKRFIEYGFSLIAYRILSWLNTPKRKRPPLPERRHAFEVALTKMFEGYGGRTRRAMQAALARGIGLQDAELSAETVRYGLNVETADSITLDFFNRLEALPKLADLGLHRNHLLPDSTSLSRLRLRPSFESLLRPRLEELRTATPTGGWGSTATNPRYRVQAKLVAVVAEDETDWELLADDDMFAAMSFFGPGLQESQVPPFKAGEFDDGDEVVFSPHKLLFDTPIDLERGFPQEFVGMFSLAESDSSETELTLEEITGLCGTLAGVAGGAGNANEVLYLVALVSAGIRGLFDLIEDHLRDDLFSPLPDTFVLSSFDQLQEYRQIGEQRFGPISLRQLEWRSHEATYLVVYYWQIVSDEYTAADYPPPDPAPSGTSQSDPSAEA